jgi:hypothetical protein
MAQFKGLVQASRALDIFTMSQAELMDDNSARREDVWRVVDSASSELFGRGSHSGGGSSLTQRRWNAFSSLCALKRKDSSKRNIRAADYTLPRP